jgi:hypothetical protein
MESMTERYEYLCWRSIPLFTFSNPFRIPERSKLKESTGFMNFIKYNRTSVGIVDKFMIDMLVFKA